jgi:lipopolysaccharide transport system permease protein
MDHGIMPSRSNPFWLILRYRALLLRTTLVEIRSLYAGSALGMLWVALGPLVLLTLYSIVYVLIFQVRPADFTTGEYVLYVFSGLIPTIAFASALTAGSNALLHNRQILLNTLFPAELLPLRAVLVQSVSLPVGLAIVAMVVPFVKASLGPAVLIVPVLIVLQVMFVTGLVWVLSLLTLAVRDIQQLLQYATIILLIVTPIAYTPDMIPGALRLLALANPLYYFTAAFQAALVFGALPAPSILAGCVVLAFGSLFAGYWIFQRVKLAFYDYA